MTNCPNCGAPYALDSPVCEYCGTVREDEDGGEWIEMKTILGETFRRYEPRRLFEPTQQTAYGAQTTANAAACMINGFQDAQQAAVNANFNFTRAAYEQDVHVRELLQAQTGHSEAAQYLEDFLKNAFIVTVVTVTVVIIRAALMLIGL